MAQFAVQAAMNGLNTFGGGATTPGAATPAPPAGHPAANAADRNGAATDGPSSPSSSSSNSSSSSSSSARGGAHNGARAPPPQREQQFGFGVSGPPESLAEHEWYVRIGGRQLVGIYLSVWARKPVSECISGWQVRACTFLLVLTRQGVRLRRRQPVSDACKGRAGVPQPAVMAALRCHSAWQCSGVPCIIVASPRSAELRVSNATTTTHNEQRSSSCMH
jgi:hypothetical protein